MGSPLGPALANVFMCRFKSICLEPVLHISNQLFTEDSLIIRYYFLGTKDHAEILKNHLNKQYKNIKFTSAVEENGLL